MHVVGTVTGRIRGTEPGDSNDTHASATGPDARL
jgi:hypothetical protein